MLKFITKILLTLILFIGNYNNHIFANKNFKKNIKQYKNAIVTIKVDAIKSAVGTTGSWSGSGFIADLENGIIFTNAHVAPQGMKANYELKFKNGQIITDVKLIYTDAYADLSVLKINKPKSIPSTATQIEFANEAPKVGDKLYVISNSESKGFSVHDGHLSNLYEINGSMPQASFVISVNLAGGSSGSPVLNENGKAIGIIYGGSQTSLFALKSYYPKLILDNIRNKTKISRQSSGLIIGLYDLDKIVKHRGFSEKLLNEYLAKFPESNGKILQVEAIIPGTKNPNIQVGDVIWKVNGEHTHADLELFDKLIDQSLNKQATISLYRGEKQLTVNKELFNVNNYNVNKFVDFAGIRFFEANEQMAIYTGIKLGALSAVYLEPNSSAKNIPHNKTSIRIMLLEADNKKITSLDELIKAIPELLEKEKISIKFKNFMPYPTRFNSHFVTYQFNDIDDLDIDDCHISRLFYLNNANEWKSTLIQKKNN